MKNFKLIRLNDNMKICGEFATLTPFKSTQELFDWISQAYISRVITQDLQHDSGEYAVISIDSAENYVACECVLQVVNWEIVGYRPATAADELQISKFYGIE